MIDNLLYSSSFPFVRYAFIVCILISLCAAVLGVILVLKRFSYLGDGLSHFAFGVVAFAAVIGLTDNLLLVLPLTALCAILLLKTGQNPRVKGDAATAVVSVSSLAVGYLLLNVFSPSANLAGDVCSTLFGSSSLLTLKKSDVILCAVLTAVILIAFVLLYNRIFAVTFDEPFALATGTKASLYNTLLAVLASVVIVMAMKLVGSLLISALLVFPALSALRVFKSFKAVILCAGILSVVCAFAGLAVSVVFSTPAGATVVAADLVAFLIFCAVGKGKK